MKKVSITARITSWYTIFMIIITVALLIVVIHVGNLQAGVIAKEKLMERVTDASEEIISFGENYVIDSDLEVVHLKNLNNNKIFEETNLPDDIKKVVFKDCILRYKNGEYNWDKELTDKYMSSFKNI